MTIKFDMKVNQNSASFFDEETKDFVVVHSFDNRRFNVRVGKMNLTRVVGAFKAGTDAELNKNLFNLAAPWLTRIPDVDLEPQVKKNLSSLPYEEINSAIHTLEQYVLTEGRKPAEGVDQYRLAHVKAGLAYLWTRQSESILKILAISDKDHSEGRSRPARDLLAERKGEKQ